MIPRQEGQHADADVEHPDAGGRPGLGEAVGDADTEAVVAAQEVADAGDDHVHGGHRIGPR